MSVSPGSYSSDVTPDDVRDVFERENEGSEAPADNSKGNAAAEDAIEFAEQFAGARIYDRVTPRVYNEVVAYLAADYLYAPKTTVSSGEKKTVKSGGESITYFKSGDAETDEKFAEVAELRDTSNRLFTKTTSGFLVGG